eukprot:CAMPEP_0118637522 /NCGR_PEP_ID=MMETSP0785-20121206/3195_1 /TAXON_ID=91992 /ORGANISM="Bolidomonas pacifica, Strain CCMP 1866" /LENGTH=343 /DNA_ID=CAMNT_0006528709 /DNA_START=42 /DNA_END=1070 /DNA_ORIENTATION=-
MNGAEEQENETSSPPEAVKILLMGGAGVYSCNALVFNGVARNIMIDTGSPLTWVAVEAGDNDLQEDDTGRMEDGDSYADGQSFEGIFRYGELQLGESLTGCFNLKKAHCLIVSHSIKYSTRGVLGLSLRLAAPFKIDGVRHPGDLCRRIVMEFLPRERRVVGLEIDRTQAHSQDLNGNNLGPSNFLFGGMHADREQYCWSEMIPKAEVDWIVELDVTVSGPNGDLGGSFLRKRVLIDSGCSHFKVSSDLGSLISKVWGFSILDDPPPRSKLKSSAIVIRLGGKVIKVKARDLILKENPDVDDGSQQCNRIEVCEGDEEDEFNHDLTFGMALLAGFKAVAFDFE